MMTDIVPLEISARDTRIVYMLQIVANAAKALYTI